MEEEKEEEEEEEDTKLRENFGKNLLENVGIEEDINKTDLQEKRCVVNWIHLTRNRLKWNSVLETD